MISYVLGFVMWGDRVLLIRKNRPAWQAGKLNGIGGKVEAGESPRAAMVRECWEETAIHTTAADWRLFALMDGTGWDCSCYVAEIDQVWNHRSVTDEILGVYDTKMVPPTALPNVPYLIAMARDKDLQDITYLHYR